MRVGTVVAASVAAVLASIVGAGCRGGPPRTPPAAAVPASESAGAAEAALPPVGTWVVASATLVLRADGTGSVVRGLAWGHVTHGQGARATWRQSGSDIRIEVAGSGGYVGMLQESGGSLSLQREGERTSVLLPRVDDWIVRMGAVSESLGAIEAAWDRPVVGHLGQADPAPPKDTPVGCWAFVSEGYTLHRGGEGELTQAREHGAGEERRTVTWRRVGTTALIQTSDGEVRTALLDRGGGVLEIRGAGGRRAEAAWVDNRSWTLAASPPGG